ncbi:MAG: GntR family transcriptional regulator [Rhodobacteraceae bacterium]|jgi:GntR family transcriptional regulator|nr:GntR family transcriptional regulator [Paracoccaceae bacterium]
MNSQQHLADEEGSTPKYHQIYLVLRQEIRDGLYPEDTPIPSEVELGHQFGVSRITVRKALERLEREGAIDRQRGRGTFVRPSTAQPHVAASLSGSIENLIAMGLQTSVKVLSFDYIPAPAIVRDAMGLPVAARVQRAVRIRTHEEVPFSHLTTFVPEAIGRNYSVEDLSDQPLLMLLAKAGITVGSAEQTITAKLATPEIARHLKMLPGEPLLCIDRVVRDVDGHAIEMIRGLYRPDTYSHQMNIERAQQGTGRMWQT